MKQLIIFFAAITLAGCAASSIKIKPSAGSTSFSMFGKTPSRNFSFEGSVNDSIKKKWEAEINGGFSNSSISVYDKFVFINDLSGRVYCFNLENGKTIGYTKTDGPVYTTPVIAKNQIIFISADEKDNVSSLVYYNFLDGSEEKSKEIKGRVLTQLIKIEDGIIFNSEIGKVYKYDLFGNKIWETDTKSFTHSSPALENNVVLFGNDEGEIISIDAKDGKVLFRKKISKKPFFSGVSFSNETAFIGNDDGYLYAVKPNGDVKWKFNTNYRITMTPAVNENEVIAGNLFGNLFAVNKNTGKKIWELKTDGVLNVTPLITKNYVIVPDLDKKFYFVNLSNGRIDKTIDLDGRSKLTPVITQNLLFIGYDDGVLDAYEF